jgi:hypothetical protein
MDLYSGRRASRQSLPITSHESPITNYSALSITRHIRFVIDGMRDTDSLLGAEINPQFSNRKKRNLFERLPLAWFRKAEEERRSLRGFDLFPVKEHPQTPFQYEIMAH